MPEKIAAITANKRTLEDRWPLVSSLIRTSLALPVGSNQLQATAEYVDEGVWAGLVGGPCERISRNRGDAVWVAPVCEFSKGLAAWLGWQEQWEVQSGTHGYRFKNTSLTVFLGRHNEAVKPQLLRLEWSGYAGWPGSAQASFQSPGAGHPHWQIDLIESLQYVPDAARFEVADEAPVEDFEAANSMPTIAELARRFSIEDMHLASAAHWWLPPAAGEVRHHMNAPRDLHGLNRWIQEGINYLRQELRRCKIRP